MSQKLLRDLANLRLELQDGGKQRRHRYKIVDRKTGNTLAKFDELIYAENSLQQMRDNLVKQLEQEDEHPSISLSVA